ncbi:hypothetical protein [Streptomyces sp. NPDC006552]|uniref:hypothetical protein n=1 Tax=Streptomyces sp. NPDC006552 TaxID=3157179 RepID=UPI0033A40578
MKRGMKLTAVAAMVVLALTGFSTGRGHSRGHHSSSGGGGGCSSSSQNHGSSSNSSTSGGSYGSSGSTGSTGSTYDDDDDDRYGSGTGGSSYNRRPGYRSTPTSSASGSGRTAQEGTARLITCAGAGRPYATVEVRNPNARRVRFAVHVTFTDASGATVKDTYHEVKAGAKDKVTVRVPVGSADRAARVEHCAVDRDATVV